VITGSNFRVRDPSWDIPAPSGATVRVTIGGRSAKVSVETATQLRVEIPPYLGSPTEIDESTREFPESDIVISNLDDAGAVIPGESVVVADGFTYVAPALRLPDVNPANSALTKVVIEFLSLLRRSVVPEAWWQVHTDYADDGGTGSKLSEHPAAAVRVRILKDPSYGYFDNSDIEDGQGDGTWDVYPASITCMVVFDVTFSCEHKSEGLMMWEHAMALCRLAPWLIVPADPDFSEATENYYPLELVNYPEQISGPSGANVFAAQASWRVRGIPLVPTVLIGKVYDIDTINLATSDLDSTKKHLISI